MTDPLARLRRFLRELKRRKVYRVAVGYLVAAFVVLQLAGLAADAFGFPGWFEPMIWVLAGLGLPIAVVLAWAFEVTPEGVRRTRETAGGGDEAGSGAASGSRTAVGALVGLGVLAAAAAGVWHLVGSGGKSPEITERSLAVLPFEVSGSGADEWRDGMVSLLAPGLDGAAGLRVIPDRTIFAVWEERQQAGSGVSSDEAVAVARQVGARYAVLGSAVALGSGLRLTVDVRDTQSGDRLGRVEVRGSRDSVMALADSLTRQVLGVLLEEGGEAIPSVDIASLTTGSLDALKSYLAGERHFRAGNYESALRDYRAAVRQDSTFALAYSRLATARSMVEGTVGADLRSIRRAHELSGRLPRRERRLVWARYTLSVDRRPLVVADSLRRWTELYPDDPGVWNSFGEVLWHNAVPQGWPEADRAFERAVELDPGVAIYHLHLINLAFSVHRDSALAARRIARQPATGAKEMNRLTLELVFGSDDHRRGALARLDTMSPAFEGLPFWPVVASLWHPQELHLLEEVLLRIRERDDLPFPAQYERALVWVGLLQGRIEEAVRRLENAGLTLEEKGCLLARSMTLGLPVPDSVVEPPLDPREVSEDASVDRLLCSGLYLVEKGRSAAATRMMGRLRERASRASGQSTAGPGPGGEARRAVRQLQGYRAWREGDLHRAEEQWSGWAEPGLLARHGAIWRGDLYRRLGKLEMAEGWYLAAWLHPIAHERLGQLYEEMGQPEKAAAAYRRFLAAWKDADPELQPRVEEARKRREGLTGSDDQTHE